MRKILIICFVSFLGACAHLEKPRNLKVEVSNHVSNHIADITLNLTEKDINLDLVNAASAELINIRLQVHDILVSPADITIKCLSQCALNLYGDDNLKINNLRLVNAHLFSNSNLVVNNLYISSSEAIKTGLTKANNVYIKIAPSTNMLKVQKLLKGVNIIPGSGEFIYDTKIVYSDNGNKINANSNENLADSLVNFKHLKKNLPNLEWAAPTIAWFGVGATMNVKDIHIVPGVDNKGAGFSRAWHVNKYNRQNAYLTSRDAGGRPNYGGTCNDEGYLSYITMLKKHNIKVMFYPMLFMDMPGKPWRGFVFGKNSEDIHKFFVKDNGYNQFILHYAKLLKGSVDAFVIGSEMQNLTQSIDTKYAYPDPRRYPAVLELINLAKQVKEILGPKVIVTYAANWSEYHHDVNLIHHLDNLWISPYIDVVGIDAYLPITNKSMGDISIDEIKAGWQSGDLWNYYYDPAKSVSIVGREWGLKQIEFWWSNEHYDYKGMKTKWKPKMKPIWFTEFGFPSMHMASNTPNAFWNPHSVAGGVPRKSSGRPDFAIQMRAIQGTLEYWQQKKNVVQNMFLWAWDVRPFPYYPNRIDIWSDGEVWSRGHWINGKIEPQSQVRLLSGFEVGELNVDADELVIEKGSKAIQVNAKNVDYF